MLSSGCCGRNWVCDCTLSRDANVDAFIEGHPGEGLVLPPLENHGGEKGGGWEDPRNRKREFFGKIETKKVQSGSSVHNLNEKTVRAGEGNLLGKKWVSIRLRNHFPT